MLEAMRLVMGRYKARTVQSKRGYSMAIGTTTQARKAEYLEATLLQLERNINNCEDLVGRPMGVALIELPWWKHVSHILERTRRCAAGMCHIER